MTQYLSMTQPELPPPNATPVTTLPLQDAPKAGDRILNLTADGTLTRLLTASLASQGPKGDRGETGKDATSPIGDIKIWLTEEIPAGWLILNGSAFDKAQYPKLFAFLKAETLPDFRNRIPRGAGDLIKLGEQQEDAMQNATSTYKNFATYYLGRNKEPSEGALCDTGDTGYGYAATPNQWCNDVNQRYFNPTSLHFDLSKSEARTSDETRVKAIGIHYIIKAG